MGPGLYFGIGKQAKGILIPIPILIVNPLLMSILKWIIVDVFCIGKLLDLVMDFSFLFACRSFE